MGRVILGTDCAAARKYFGHVPVRFAERGWPEPEPLRDGDRTPLPLDFGEDFLVLRTDPMGVAGRRGHRGFPGDFLPLEGPLPVCDGETPVSTSAQAEMGPGPW
jgi:hypothetical protein